MRIDYIPSARKLFEMMRVHVVASTLESREWWVVAVCVHTDTTLHYSSEWVGQTNRTTCLWMSFVYSHDGHLDSAVTDVSSSAVSSSAVSSRINWC